MKPANSATPTPERKLPKAEILLFLVVGLVLEIVQGAVLPGFLRTELILILVTYVSWYSPPLKSAFVGTLFGILQDYLSGAFIGLNGLSKTLLGFAASYISRWSAPDLGSWRILIIAFLAVFDRILVLGILLLLGQTLSTPNPIEAFSSAALTGALGELFFRLYDKIRFPPKDFSRLA